MNIPKINSFGKFDIFLQEKPTNQASDKEIDEKIQKQ